MNDLTIQSNANEENEIIGESPLTAGSVRFTALGLLPEIQRAIEEMGFEHATSIQSEAIPLIQTGIDVIGRSQTGTGKTIAFGIPALDLISRDPGRGLPRVLILCSTRELAQQACDEMKKLSAYMHNVRVVEIYGGVPMDRQILRLKKADLVIGTPGRVMDHMRRRTLKLDDLRMVVLDEADEMLSMGFKEDIETILAGAPDELQTVLFSATMPPAIMALTKQFQKNPRLIEIDKARVTLENIGQYYMDVPMGRKLDALNLLLRFQTPTRSMIFCNTKRMVDEVTEYLEKNGFSPAGLHGDMNQSQRTKTMELFKSGKTPILVATDVAARGIDVNDIDYVINYDIPQNTEYYVHRIGRTGRAGKSGTAITVCSGRRQVFTLRDIGRMAKSDIQAMSIPTPAEIRQKSLAGNMEQVEKTIEAGLTDTYVNMVNELIASGKSLPDIAAAALQLTFGKTEKGIVAIAAASRSSVELGGGYKKIVINIGRNSRCAPNHIVGAIAEQTGLRGGEIGKIEIYDDRTVVAIPAQQAGMVVDSMQGLKILGRPTTTTLIESVEPMRRVGGSGGTRHNVPRPGSNHKRPGTPHSGTGTGTGRGKPFYKKG